MSAITSSSRDVGDDCGRVTPLDERVDGGVCVGRNEQWIEAESRPGSRREKSSAIFGIDSHVSGRGGRGMPVSL